MPKTATFTTITPLPAGIARKSVLDMYQDHMAMIDLNPLVVERFRCRPPSYAPADEYFAAWYTIKDKVSYLPGGLANGSVSYHACFYDTPEGLQTHVYAPLGLDIRGKWSVGGSLPGEPKQIAAKGLNTPRHGIYIREDVTMTCSSLLMGFVKRTFKDSHASLVEKLVEKAHLLESNFANERLRALRNVEPGERMAIGNIFIAPPPDYRPWGYLSPYPQSPSEPSPSPRHQVFSEPTPSPRYSAPILSPHHRVQADSSPYYSSPVNSSHSRSRSDPVPSPGFSSASTLVSDNDRPATPPKDTEQLKFAMIAQPSTSAPEPSMYLLPATTYNGGLAVRGHARQESDRSVFPPRISYTPEERPISFTIPFDTRSSTSSRFDTSSNSETSSEPSNLLDEIDDAIDQVFLYSVTSHTSDDSHTAKEEAISATKTYELPATTYELPATTYELPATTYKAPATAHELPATTYELPATKYTPEPILAPTTYSASATAPLASTKPIILSAKKYEPSSNQITLPSTTYTPERIRKDSAIPAPWLEKELPPVPVDGR